MLARGGSEDEAVNVEIDRHAAPTNRDERQRRRDEEQDERDGPNPGHPPDRDAQERQRDGAVGQEHTELGGGGVT